MNYTVFSFFLFRPIYPHFFLQLRRLRYLPAKPFRMPHICFQQYFIPLSDRFLRFSVVHDFRCQQRDSGMPVFTVIPAEKPPAEISSLFNRTESGRKSRTIFQSFELRLREGIIVRYVWAGVCFGHTQIGHQQGDWLGSHGTAAVCMNRQLLRLNALANTGGSNQFLGQTGRFTFGDQPPDRVTAEDVQNVVQVVVSPLSDLDSKIHRSNVGFKPEY